MYTFIFNITVPWMFMKVFIPSMGYVNLCCARSGCMCIYVCMHMYVCACMCVCVDAHVYVCVLCLHVYVHA